MIDQKQLMIHVERIVRPVRATERRKLKMRRELLAHLQAALEEEREHTQNEQLAWEAATKRLGMPTDLTRSLQRSVPLLERLLLGAVPLAPWMNHWEKKMGEQMGMGGMSGAQQTVFTLGSAILTYGSAAVLAQRLIRMHREALIQGLGERSWTYLAGTLIANVMLIVLMGSCFGLVGAAARGKGRRTIMTYGIWIAATLLIWQISTVTLLARQRVAIPDLAWGAMAAILLTAALAWLGRLTSKVGRPYREWLTLDISS